MKMSWPFNEMEAGDRIVVAGRNHKAKSLAKKAFDAAHSYCRRGRGRKRGLTPQARILEVIGGDAVTEITLIEKGEIEE